MPYGSRRVEKPFQLQHPHQLLFRHADGLDDAQFPSPGVDTVDHGVDQVHHAHRAQDQQESVPQHSHDCDRRLPGLHMLFKAVGGQIDARLCQVLQVRIGFLPSGLTDPFFQPDHADVA